MGQEDLLEKGMATHSSILAWRIPWTEEPGGLPSMGSQRVGHDLATNTFPLLFLKKGMIITKCDLREPGLEHRDFTKNVGLHRMTSSDSVATKHLPDG